MEEEGGGTDAAIAVKLAQDERVAKLKAEEEAKAAAAAKAAEEEAQAAAAAKAAEEEAKAAAAVKAAEEEAAAAAKAAEEEAAAAAKAAEEEAAAAKAAEEAAAAEQAVESEAVEAADAEGGSMEEPDEPTAQEAEEPEGTSGEQDDDETILDPHEIKCDSRWISQVIGPKGSTIQSLQEESGAKIEVDDHDEPGHHKITIHGHAKAHSVAIAKVMAIIKFAENPDYEGDEGRRLRAEAQRCYDERSRCMDEKNKAFDEGDHGRGHELQAEANDWAEKAKAANVAASEAILAFNNEGKGDMFSTWCP